MVNTRHLLYFFTTFLPFKRASEKAGDSGKMWRAAGRFHLEEVLRHSSFFFQLSIVENIANIYFFVNHYITLCYLMVYSIIVVLCNRDIL